MCWYFLVFRDFLGVLGGKFVLVGLGPVRVQGLGSALLGLALRNRNPAHGADASEHTQRLRVLLLWRRIAFQCALRSGGT